jgi:salicylate hydroxylase
MTSDFSVAIIGGGLGGLSLAVSLTKRSVPFTIYEADASFTEIGAGINLNPCSRRALGLIYEPLFQGVRDISTRNPPGKEDVWLQIRYGAGPREGEVITEIIAEGTGNMTCHRKELLSMLVDAAKPMKKEFNKKLKVLQQFSDHVQMTFTDGTTASASVVIGADGIHSTIRQAMLPKDDPRAKPSHTGTGLWRALLPIEDLVPILGEERARTGAINIGPDGYVIMYPVSQGKFMNVGLWKYRREPWTSREWIAPNQHPELVEAFRNWGDAIHKVIDICPPETAYWATHHHGNALDHYYDGRVAVMGDAAHSMTPHAGAGAGQAVEDAYVLGELFEAMQKDKNIDVTAALKAYSAIRQPRAQKVLENSAKNFHRWSATYHEDMTEVEIQKFQNWGATNWRWIWDDDIVNQATRAKRELGILESS